MRIDDDSRRFIKLCILVLGLDESVTVRLHKRKLKTYHKNIPKEAIGLHFFNETTRKHEIDALVTKYERGGTLAILAHEFAHAWVEENHPKAKPHGRAFQRTCAGLRKALKDWGYNLQPLYKRSLDV